MKKLFVTTVLALVSLSAIFSQATFQKAFYAPNHSLRALDVLKTTDSQLLFAGSRSTLSGLTAMGFLAKADFDGNLLWTHTCDFGFTGNLSRVAEAGGFYYAVGSVNTGIVFSCPLLKIGQDGNVVWKKRLDYRDYTVPSAFISTNDGALLIAGTADDDSTAKYSFVVKADTSGNIVWKTSITHHASRDLDLHDAIQNANGTYYITGTANDPGASFSKVSFVALLDSAGGVIWSKKIESGNRFVGFQKLLPTTANGCYAAGIFQNGNKNICLAKIDNTGSITFTKSYTITGGDIHLRGLDYNGSDIVFAGIHEKTGDADTDMFVFRTNLNGALLTARTTGNTDPEEAREMIAYEGNGRLLLLSEREKSSGNEMLVTVTTSDLLAACDNHAITVTVTDEAIAANNLTLITGNGGSITSGLFNSPVITMKDTLLCGEGVGIADVQNVRFEIFPNPASSEFKVSGLKFKVGCELRIFDAMGKRVYATQVSEPTLNVELQTLHLEDGLYFVQLNSGKELFTQKLIVKR